MSVKNFLAILLIAFVFGFGFLLRAQETLSNNFLFLLDQGRDMMAVKGIIYDHHFTLIGPNTSLQGVFQGPLWYYLLSIPTILLNGNPLGTVLLMLIISLTVMGVVVFFMEDMFGYKIGLLALFLIAISPEAIAAATYSWNPHPMWLLLTIFIFSYHALKRGNKKMHILVWPIISLMFHFEAALAIFVLFAAFILQFLNNRSIFKNKYFLIGVTCSFIFFIPQMVFELKHNFLMTHSFLNLFQGGSHGLSVGSENKFYTDVLKNHVNAFIINYESSFFHEGVLQNIPFALFIYSTALFLMDKIRKIFSDKERAFLNTLYAFVCIVFLLTFFYPFSLRYWFLTGFEIFYVLIATISLGKLLNNHIGKIVILSYCVFSIWLLSPKIYSQYMYPDYGGVAKIKGKLDAIKYIYADANGKPFNVLVFNPPVYTDAYDYLSFWYGKSRSYIPGKEKKGIFYLLIEPDPAKPWSYQGWLDTVIKSGDIIYSTELASGLIIQKRIEK